MLLLQLHTLRDCLLHSLNHLCLFQLQLTKFVLFDLDHLLLGKHFLVQVLLMTELTQLGIQELALLQLVSVLPTGLCFLKVFRHLMLFRMYRLLAPLFLAYEELFDFLLLLLVLDVASFNLNILAGLELLFD